jgi:hypothetical protein
MDSVDNTIKVKDSSGNIYPIPLGKTARDANKFVTNVDQHGIQQTAAIAGTDLPAALITRTAAVTDLAPVVGDSGLFTVISPATAIHLTRIWCAIQGSTNVVVNLDKRTEAAIGTDTGNHLLSSDLTAVTGGANTSTFANGAGQCGGTGTCAIAAHAPVVAIFTSVSGTPNTLQCTVDYTVD